MGHGGGHEIGGHKVAYFAGLAFNMDTLYMTWLTMAIVIILAVLATRRLSLVPSGWQNALEMVILALLEQIEAAMGPKGKKLAPLLITLFLFLLVANELGLVPGFTSPTNDLNTTLGLALLVIAVVHVAGAANKGLFNYLKHFLEPNVLFLPINIIEEVSKPVTLSFRLFGNILAGEILIIILGILVPYVIPTAWLAFSVFVGIVQAFIFTILSMSYISNALKDDHH
ncbi:F0F1 ATP synthase subunit A [Sporolituus thermophilus]|uniref:ATP synthase subunit a n=1 Tax=Sporolituus thermophilus DSM 23256 TaxID=1123285 RepID=A0A1G7HGW3_9FIRM|nr:F0F1 ATP synthase subunit A [Sporolituus thermophilus]SDE99712.1 ATP synthase F0 subcomplex A subunit [Sporolituus thermophilus DSM 23256]